MGNPADIELYLIPPENGEFYSGDENISGTLKLKLTKALPIKKITVHLKGITETQTKVNTDYMMSQNGMLTPVQDNRSYHRVLDLEKRLFPPDNVWDALEGSSKPFKIHPGEYSYEFSFPALRGMRPRCLKHHTRNMICFLKKRDTRLPPSFNLKWKELNKIDNLDLFFFSFGKIFYIVEVNIEMGKPKIWFKPFDKILRETKSIEYIPTVKDITYPDNGTEKENNDTINSNKSSRNSVSRTTHTTRNTSTLEGKVLNLSNTSDNSRSSSNRQPSNVSGSLTPNDLDRDNNNNTNSNGEIVTVNTNKYKLYQSTYKLNLLEGVQEMNNSNISIENSMWVEVRSKNDGFKQIFRNDPLFRRNSNKFDRIFLTCKGSLSVIKKLSIKPIRVQLNLIENATYLSKGVANENFSSLRLVELNLEAPLISDIFDIKDLKPRISSNLLNTIDENKYIGKSDCEIKLREHPQLRRLLFNEEDYKHRGNRLYSFKTCTIRRTFYLELLIDWSIEGVIKQTEVRIDPIQIYCQTRNSNGNGSNFGTLSLNRDDVDFLPRYIEPPVYNEIPDNLVINEDTQNKNNNNDNKNENIGVAE